jgi:DNA-binding MarR family transcriptional regulator
VKGGSPLIEETDRMFEAAHRFKQLNIAEKMNLIPQSEMMAMKVIQKLSAEGKKYGVSEIAKYLSISPPAISRTIKKLREKQYVECLTDETDRRNTYIQISEKGYAALEADSAKVRNFMQSALSHLKKEEIDQFYDLFNKIYVSMKQELDRLDIGHKTQ